MKRIFNLFLLLTLLTPFTPIQAEDGYRLWLRYDAIQNKTLLKQYQQVIRNIRVEGSSPVIESIEKELLNGLSGLLQKNYQIGNASLTHGTLLLTTKPQSAEMEKLNLEESLATLGNEGFIIKSVKIGGKNILLITANTDNGLLYGAFHLLRLLQMHEDIRNLDIVEKPLCTLRMLNHWDNLDQTVERGYAGSSIWNWHKLPVYLDQRYEDYARANASIGINATSLTNVNANALILTPHYLEKAAALAEIFRKYGIKVFLTARFSAPMEIGNLPTADPEDEQVQEWWKKKADEIYAKIPDFGGFLVKANSEGQPGPQNYGRSHAQGANLLAEALAPHGGVVIWRAFVYENEVPEDRARQAFSEFKPLDGSFLPNVMVQVKNGPIDFQPREPFHPLFGAMPKTPVMMEFQITQEYLGFSSHLVFLASLFKEVLDADTYAKEKGSTVASVVDGSLHQHTLNGMAGVSNIGSDRNWTGHIFGQSNWYAFGRLAWNHRLDTETIAREWIKCTLSNEEKLMKTVLPIMLNSHETLVSYMTPLGLHHIMGWDHHYGPAPWIKEAIF